MCSKSLSQWWNFVSYPLKMLWICTLCQPSRSYCFSINCFSFILSCNPNPNLLYLTHSCVCVQRLKGGLVGGIARLMSLYSDPLSQTLFYFLIIFFFFAWSQVSFALKGLTQILFLAIKQCLPNLPIRHLEWITVLRTPTHQVTSRWTSLSG